MKKVFSFVIFSLALASAFALVGQDLNPTQLGQGQQEVKVDFSLQASKLNYCVGEYPRYTIVGTSTLAGQSVRFTTTYRPFNSDPQAPPVVVERDGYYGPLLPRDGMSFWSYAGPVFNMDQAGTWTRTATIAGVSRSVKFNVNFCDSSAAIPARTYLNPPSGAILFYRMPTDSVEFISLVCEGHLELSRVAGWRVVVNNQDATSAVNGLPGIVREEMFEVDEPIVAGMGRYFPAATAIRIPYPTRYLKRGANQIEVTLKLIDGTMLFASAEYIVYPTLEAVIQPPGSLPDEKLSCGVYQTPPALPAGQYFDLWARGGDGTYTWYAGDATATSGKGPGFGTAYTSAGVKTVWVVSGNTQKCSINITVLPAPPLPPPQAVQPPTVEPIQRP